MVNCQAPHSARLKNLADEYENKLHQLLYDSYNKQLSRIAIRNGYITPDVTLNKILKPPSDDEHFSAILEC